MQTLLLPGMDGTGRLFASLKRHLPDGLGARVVSFPTHRVLGYDELAAQVEVPTGPFSIVAESFSGPLAIRLASRYSRQIERLVLAASFVRSPSALARWVTFIGPRFFHATPPSMALRWILLGADAGDEEVEELRSALRAVAPEVMANRLREIVSVDVTKEFASGSVPVLYIRGAHDRVVGRGVGEQLEMLRPDMETRVLDGPHLILQRRPAEAARVISEFLLAKAARGPV